MPDWDEAADNKCYAVEHGLALWALGTAPGSDICWLISREPTTGLLYLERLTVEHGCDFPVIGSA